ncbi:hypothetical protein NIES4071_06680 [Calothrix sp. NIES-4071]|nr:hypothetical protein NIES4071_06680 [Calothrix sp. NIES-4071]BAZ55010.1 hypothetical protein NIES4105_06640 [Calothrix sp. NIES-4105]
MTSITKTVTINVLSDDNGRYHCQISPSVEQPPHEIHCYGQSEEHAIAIALEQLASQYREIAEVSQNKDWEAVERSASSEPIKKRYHVILHYERIIKAESKFEALQDTLLGNTVVENAKVTLIEIDPNLPVQPLT